MTSSFWIDARVTSRVEQLRRRPAERQVFGADGHGFEFFPRLDAAGIDAFERTHDIELPDPYRSFLSDVGNGGAGPGYGVFPLGCTFNSARDTRPWEPDLDDGVPSRPFPHVSEWNLPAEWERPVGITDSEMEGWFERRDAVIWGAGLNDGTMPIVHMGCAIMVELVVTGERRGELWVDDRGSDQGIYPLQPVDFGAWYLSWLDETESS